MRSSKSRSRGKSNRNRSFAGGGNITNRVFDSSGPEGKVRGTPQQIIDKYNQLVRDAQLSNDRVAAENFAQHAEHYTRLLAENQREIDAKRESQEAQNRDRQAQRDQERAERLERQEAHQANAPVESAAQPVEPTSPLAEAPQNFVQDDLGSSPQPDLIDAGQADSGLVETPETKPRKQNRGPRKPRVEKPLDSESPQQAAAEEKPKRAPRPRRRKPVEPKAEVISDPAPQTETSGE